MVRDKEELLRVSCWKPGVLKPPRSHTTQKALDHLSSSLPAERPPTDRPSARSAGEKKKKNDEVAGIALVCGRHQTVAAVVFLGRIAIPRR
jgi:hypothetical protein